MVCVKRQIDGDKPELKKMFKDARLKRLWKETVQDIKGGNGGHEDSRRVVKQENEEERVSKEIV